MKQPWEPVLERWVHAGLLDPPLAERIRAWELDQEAQGNARLRWPAVLALTFGTLMVGAGVLLFVAAHWDRMGPMARFATVLSKVALFHLAGAWFTARMPRLAVALHGLGTLALGAAVFLAGQIFNLQEHWPGGVMLWALGAALGWGLLRDWVQGTLAAILVPAWLGAEWMEATMHGAASGSERILAFGVFLFAVTYLSCRQGEQDSLLRRSLGWVGGLALIPGVLGIVAATHDHGWWRNATLGEGTAALGWGLALAVPLGLALRLRGKGAWMNLAAALWGLLLGVTSEREWSLYAWCGLGALGLVAWGLHEGRRERLNLGMAGFAITMLAFYFSSVMDKLGRSLGLLGLGALFLLGGWQLERLRRRLDARIRGGAR